jgi:hypothetical protein
MQFKTVHDTNNYFVLFFLRTGTHNFNNWSIEDDNVIREMQYTWCTENETR